MSVEANKNTVRKFYEEVWNKGNLDVVYEVFADNYIRNDSRASHPSSGPLGQKEIAAALRGAFSNFKWTIDLLVGEGDMVVGRWTCTGLNDKPWGGLQPSGREARFTGANFFRFNKEGRVVELWNHRDDLGLMQQLGVPIHGGAVDR